ncbi:RNA polymerase sigma-70 factor [Paenibacillus sp. CF384]|uniref:RNA polymerase sigma-70 factor n=1 Tax=Paenibacillus sp. CF384 TaxID=1884382 RepID=UPI0008995ACA|nr:RNA polymerase sigma-70 factor [Paenibacillus sp. CF384]SDW79009.1 RNA polymerase sigma-70 factor, ECF subfamily [Paenibacillus sp. CF384]
MNMNTEPESSKGASSSVEDYISYRPLLFSLAYRMLGSVMDAEDVVQEAFIYVNVKRPEHITSMKAYLCKIVTNRCIDLLRSSRKQREVYVGTWLPEPLVPDAARSFAEPDDRYLQKESISTAYLLLLQQLSWVERAVFLLREVLQYEYDEIAEIVGKSSTNCRQIFRRAKLAISQIPEQDDALKSSLQTTPIEQQQPLKPPAVEKTSTIVEQFVQAIMSGNMGQLLSVVRADAVLYSDGGGKVKAAIRPILGAERIAAYFFGLLAKLPQDYTYVLSEVNGETGIVGYDGDGQPNNVHSFEIADGQISSFYIVVNPDKLRHIAAASER